MRFATLICTTLVAVSSASVATAGGTRTPAVQAHWEKFCFNDRATDFKKVCEIRAEARKPADQSLLAKVELIEREGEAQKILRVTFPLGMLLTYGTRLIVYGVDPLQRPFIMCVATGCMSDYEVTPALLGSIRNGQELVVQAIDQSNKPSSVTLSLADFWVAYDGPRTEPVFDQIDVPGRLFEDRNPRMD